MRLILFAKPGCHLCEGLQEKLEQIDTLPIDLVVQDITTREDWFQAYQYEIPVLFVEDESQPAAPPTLVPRFSPRATVAQIETRLRQFMPVG